jgi:hypothetical protein
MTPRSADPGELLRTLYLGNNAGKSFNYSWYASPDVDRLGEADRPSTRASAWRSTARSRGSSSTTPLDLGGVPEVIEVMRDDVQGYTYSP